jgi:hypothetical protein
MCTSKGHSTRPRAIPPAQPPNRIRTSTPKILGGCFVLSFGVVKL